MDFRDLRGITRKGEGLQVEFKKSLPSEPEKLVKEAIALGNAIGGWLLIGVDDNGDILGLKDPDEAVFIFRKVMKRHCRPNLKYELNEIPISKKRAVMAIRILDSAKKPHFFVEKPYHKRGKAYFRVEDRSIQASYELFQIIKNFRRKEGVSFEYGDKEKWLLDYLKNHPSITLQEFIDKTSLPRSSASKVLVKLSSANVLKIMPSETGDHFILQKTES